MRPIFEVARELGLRDDELDPRGRHVAKVALSAIRPPRGRLILVTAMTPTARGEGKTTMTIGLADALRSLGARATATLRQPTLGPVFGKKGGGTGGGKSQLAPHELIDLHLTGDSHAVQAAHNLGASFLDNHLHHGNALGIDPASIVFPRVLDLNDRALRKIVVGLGRENGPVRESGFEITSASEVMAILALATGLPDLRERVGRIVVGETAGKKLVTLEDLKVAGAMTALLRDAIAPNLVQTREGTPVLVHAGPFANIAHGCSSVLADRVALGLADFVLTEAGFGADLGAEKFFDIKMRSSGLSASGAVLVATVFSLAAHGGGARGREAIVRGGENLAAHVEVLRTFGVPCVVAINAAREDSPEELGVALEVAQKIAGRAVVARPFDEGAAGCVELAKALQGLPEGKPALLYDDRLSLTGKIEAVATRIYGASSVELASAAARRLEGLEKTHGRLPVCFAKTQLSLSHDPALAGRPRGFVLPVREVRLAAGAGFVTVVTGETLLMPGLPAKPGGEGIGVDESGEIVGMR